MEGAGVDGRPRCSTETRNRILSSPVDTRGREETGEKVLGAEEVGDGPAESGRGEK